MKGRKRELGIAVVGLGVGEQHARAFAAHPCCRVRWLLDFNAVRAQSVAASLPGSAIAQTYEQVLDRADVDIISIASYDDAHFEQVMRALAAGKHVFVEKPICRTIQELEKLKQGWLASGQVKLRSNLVLRAAPLYRWLREHISEGALGRLYAFDGDYLYGRLHKITEGWRSNVGAYSVMEGGGVHLVDLLMWLTGERPTSVTCVGSQVCTAGTAFRFNDFSAATFEFDSGLIGRITANFGCVHRHQHVVRLFGTDATMIYDDMGPRLHSSRDPDHAMKRLEHDPLPSAKGALIPQFVQAILDEADDAAETQSFLDGISVCIAADMAAASGQKEQIEYV